MVWHFAAVSGSRIPDEEEPRPWSARWDGFAYWAKERGTWTWVREGIGVGLVAAWWLTLKSADPYSEGFRDYFGKWLLSFSFLLMGAFCLAFTLAPLVAAPLLRFIDSVYLGASSVEAPPLNYAVAERRVQEGRWAQAAEEYERLARHHPREVRLYAEGIAAARRAGDAEMAERLLKRGRRFCPRQTGRFEAAMLTPLGGKVVTVE